MIAELVEKILQKEGERRGNTWGEERRKWREKGERMKREREKGQCWKWKHLAMDSVTFEQEGGELRSKRENGRERCR